MIRMFTNKILTICAVNTINYLLINKMCLNSQTNNNKFILDDAIYPKYLVNLCAIKIVLFEILKE